MSTVTVAVIGCGRIAMNAHFPALAQIEGLRIKYACDLIEEKAQKAKEISVFFNHSDGLKGPLCLLPFWH